MKEQRFTDQDLERIEKNIFSSIKLSDEELNGIADSPELFSKILRQINYEKVEINRIKPAEKGVFAPNFNLKNALVLAGILGALLAVTFYYLSYPNHQESNAKVVSDRSETKVEKTVSQSSPVISQQLITEKKVEKNYRKQILQTNPKTEKISLRTKKVAKPKMAEKTLVAKKETVKVVEDNRAFLPIGGGGNTEFLNEGLAIIRVEMSRAELLALGIDVLTDIGDTKIKAEILVTSDGEPHGIRFLN